MHVIGTVGLPGSGKGEAATVAREEGIPVVTMGDVVRQETADRGLDPAKDHGTVAQALREENGPAAIAERSLPMIEDRLERHEAVLVDGIRSDVEVDAFEERFEEAFTLVSIEAPFDVRRERIDTRGRDAGEADGGEGLAARDERERGFGMDDAMDRADVVVENTDTLEAFHERIRSIIREGAMNDADDEPTEVRRP
ncbi:AAA family ATPase [Natrialba sp. INN-245]|uniref:AAA family ATPase n=1 Tax=Natrialba sp. INN-245 TaxID=2690967 RepID=UPI001311CF36|nr:AAA family ATPase [Natrialba sp. INN-245]MWV41779.1 AAA family ATPase [Natrialba sp. INN-245]